MIAASKTCLTRYLSEGDNPDIFGEGSPLSKPASERNTDVACEIGSARDIINPYRADRGEYCK